MAYVFHNIASVVIASVSIAKGYWRIEVSFMQLFAKIRRALLLFKFFQVTVKMFESEVEEDPFEPSGSEYVPSESEEPVRMSFRRTRSKVSQRGGKQNFPEKLERKGKKRIRKPENWIRNIRKSKIARGEEYKTAKGRVAPERTIGLDCKCRRKCFALVGDANIKRIMDEFNAIGDKGQQDTYLGGLICPQPIARRRQRSQQAKDRKASYKYKVCFRKA